MTFAEKLRDLRTSRNLTQQELADSIGVSLRTVKSYELNETFPRYRKIYHKIAEKFEIDVNYLLTEGNDFIFLLVKNMVTVEVKELRSLLKELKVYLQVGNCLKKIKR